MPSSSSCSAAAWFEACAIRYEGGIQLRSVGWPERTDRVLPSSPFSLAYSIGLLGSHDFNAVLTTRTSTLSSFYQTRTHLQLRSLRGPLHLVFWRLVAGVHLAACPAFPMLGVRVAERAMLGFLPA